MAGWAAANWIAIDFRSCPGWASSDLTSCQNMLNYSNSDWLNLFDFIVIDQDCSAACSALVFVGLQGFDSVASTSAAGLLIALRLGFQASSDGWTDCLID